jgi:hypothetical protein
MGKGRFFGSTVALAILVAAGSSWQGCGQSNRQGISFRALGFFASGGTATDSGQNVSLTNDSEVPVDVNCDGQIDETDGGELGLQNNLIQGINVDHVDLSYRVNGGLAIPNDQYALSMRLGPSSGQETQNPSVEFRRIVIVSPAIMQFLNDNRSRLPDPPFSMVATAKAVGIADSGETFVTNSVHYAMEMFDGPRSCETPTTSPTAAATPTP